MLPGDGCRRSAPYAATRREHGLRPRGIKCRLGAAAACAMVRHGDHAVLDCGRSRWLEALSLLRDADGSTIEDLLSRLAALSCWWSPRGWAIRRRRRSGRELIRLARRSLRHGHGE